MKEIYNTIVALDQVYDALILDEQGHTLYDPSGLNKIESQNRRSLWQSLIQESQNPSELDLIFENGRLYIRKIHQAYLVVFLAPDAAAASLGLTCDLLESEPSQPPKEKKGLFNLFKKA